MAQISAISPGKQKVELIAMGVSNQKLNQVQVIPVSQPLQALYLR
jgi:hypothetical protein